MSITISVYRPGIGVAAAAAVREQGGWRTHPQPPSPPGLLGLSRSSLSFTTPAPLPCAPCGICAPVPHWSAPELQGQLTFFLQPPRGAGEHHALHQCPPGPPGPLKGREGFKGGRERAVTHPRFCLCAFCALSGPWSSGVEAHPLHLAPQGLGLTSSLISHLPTPSVASAMHGDSHDRYERLTSVSSSVDFDQRDNVSAVPPTSYHPLLQGTWAQQPVASSVRSQGPMECGLFLSKGNACPRATG